MDKAINVCWFRRDLRLHDNAALYYALKSGEPVLPLFIFDRNILDLLEDKKDSRVEFIYHTIGKLQSALHNKKSAMEVVYGRPDEVFEDLLKKYRIANVFTNHDYEPYATERDTQVRKLLADAKVQFHTYKDQVIFEKDEIVKDDGQPYVVFTPYSRKWKASLNTFYTQAYPVEKYSRNFFKTDPLPLPTLQSMGFTPGDLEFPPDDFPVDIIKKYKLQRDYPGIEGTSRLGMHLRFGTISVRELARSAQQLSDVYLNELIWREFYQMILWHFPGLGKGRAFRKEYEHIKWRNNEAEFERWCQGNTGYPLVDAGMRQLNATGFMHNRVRMVTASFLAKHLLIDWRWGEAYFASKLLDFDLASNNGGWQWAAGSGCDAAPYFRVFNPLLQAKKFDAKGTYIREWVPELDSFDYPQPIVDHDVARKRCLEVYGKALKKQL